MKKRTKNSDGDKLTIVQVIANYPDAQPVPSIKGGTEKIVYELTEELVKRGHKVYLFAAKGSRSSAELITYPKGLRHEDIPEFVMRKMPERADVIHDHTFFSDLGQSHLDIPTLCTIHLPIKTRVKYPVYVSKSALQLMGNNTGYYVYNGINTNEYEFSREKHGYLLFVGRLIRNKGILQAIEVAEKTGKRLIIAGPAKAPKFFEKRIKPRIQKNPNIQYVGAVGGKMKQRLFKHAECVLFPSIWEEPFGLVMVESMACGTPVLALRNGSVPEVLSGFPNLICSNVSEMVLKVRQKNYPSPLQLRKYVIKRFTNKKMTDSYLELYQDIIHQKSISRKRIKKRR
ncbi:glycosyltransferase family 4 protein [Paenibacillus albidus]|uniref:glycosyltransferase family 4 protein n=1 Tax=Paenibacillus albidus TaxID=2041023 RepID=UPI001BEC4F51|nr:glycosyltransferase family 4 protein [Paenibacillus albidus]MBT2290165.1 glycosyltransferase family 4 protein [Paenibacillus albidus]